MRSVHVLEQTVLFIGRHADRFVVLVNKYDVGVMLLCFFLGSFGVHRFYTGKIVTGILMLLTLGGCGIWALIDFIMILVGSFTDSDGKPIKNS